MLALEGKMTDFLTLFKKKIEKKEINIAVVGLGYVGLPLAVEFAKKGVNVLGIDIWEVIDAAKIVTI